MLSDNLEYIGGCILDYTAYYNNKTNWENDVLYIGNYLFCAEYNTIQYAIKSGTKTIAALAFEHCFNLTNITIPASVQNIGYRAFCDCKKLTDVYYGNTKDNWNSISIGEFNEGLTNATVHYASIVITTATCEEDGVEKYACTECDSCYVTKVLEKATGHDMSSFVETLVPTCTEIGEERSYCSRCNHFETRDIIAIGHDYETVVTKPTCTEKGYTTYTCHCSDLLCMR